ncbi:hypothetical protein PSP6_170014 [Paraburkholderia tropica]|nr:hypothetical protein PSP6_170014 [Paraburkholderia tropica]
MPEVPDVPRRPALRRSMRHALPFVHADCPGADGPRPGTQSGTQKTAPARGAGFCVPARPRAV